MANFSELIRFSATLEREVTVPRYDYWIHGVSTMVEDAERATDIIHFGSGTTVRQPANTDNWFHIAVPTPTIIDDEEKVGLRVVAFHAKAENADITEWHLYMGKDLVGTRQENWTGEIYQAWEVGNWALSGPLNLCFRVAFHDSTPQATFTFQGAGAGFEG